MLHNTDIKEIVEGRAKDIDICFELRDYDDWKIKFINRDVKVKVVSALSSIVPVVPINELGRVIAYFMEYIYRLDNLYEMQKRINTSLKFLERSKEHLSSEDYNHIKNNLNNVRELKNRHVRLKQWKTIRMIIIQAVASFVKVATDPFGPVASAGRNIAKGSLKITSSINAMVKRQIGDEAQRKSGKFKTVKDVYNLYKKVYLEADEQEKENRIRLNEAEEKNDIPLISTYKRAMDICLGRMEIIEILAMKSFDLTSDQFKQLTNTLIIEDDHFKLSFSKPDAKKKKEIVNNSA